jgi:hypothetical protein
MKYDTGALKDCGSYYPQKTHCDELWDPFYVEACKELDVEFPEARLLPDCGWELGLSPKMLKKLTKEVCEV